MPDKDMIPISPISSGYDTRNLDFSTKWDLSEDSYNCGTGQSNGIGPRYGMGCLPHKGTTGNFYGKLRSTTEFKFFGYLPLNLKDTDDIKTNIGAFMAITGVADKKISHDILVVDGDNYGQDIRGDLQNLYSEGGGSSGRQQIHRRTGVAYADQRSEVQDNVAVQTNASFYAKFAIFKSPQKSYPHPTIVGETIGTPSYSALADANWYPYGGSTYFNLQQYAVNEPRDVELKICNATMQARYEISDVIPSTTVYKPSLQDATSAANIDFSSYTITSYGPASGSGGSFTGDLVTILIDELHKVETGFTLIATVSGGKAIVNIVQDYVQGAFNRLPQYIDLSNPFPVPRTKETLNNYATSGNYTEDGFAKKTCFDDWPSYSNGSTLKKKADSTPNDASADTVYTFGADTGVLRTNKTYEITYSIFDKTLGHESNVGVPAKFAVHEDNTSLVLREIVANSGTTTQVCPLNGTGRWPIEPNDVLNQFLNDCQFRFYYRELGTFEWLPALFVDASDYLANPDPQFMLACTGQEFGVVGGQPGGFNDYSPLPQDNYVDVVTYRSRLFFLSNETLRWSNTNDPLSFALRNSIPSASDKFIGMTVHNYPGQAEQRARLIVFGSNQIYVGSFTGKKQQQQVQIGSELSIFDVDGSDFVLEPWTTDTTYSSRSFVVADGYLYYWGPTGVFVDDGVQTPKKLSTDIEPEIFELVDDSKHDEIFAVYNNKTKDVIFFYTPKDTSTYKKHALVFNRNTGQFYPWRFKGNIVWAQNLEIDQKFSWAGERIVIGVKNDSNDKVCPFFFDHKCQGGDYTSEDFISFQGVDVVGSNFALSFYDQTESLTIGSVISITNINDYFPGVDMPNNIKATITEMRDTSPKTLSGYFTTDLTLPEFFEFEEDDYSLCPAFFDSQAIDWAIENTYFCPGGLYQEWIFHYLHFLMRIKSLETIMDRNYSLTHSTPTGDENTLTVDIEDNSKGHCQRYVMLEEGINSNRGQGLKLKLSGSDIFTGWVLQYLSLYANTTQSEFLQEFE